MAQVEYNLITGQPNVIWAEINNKVKAYKGANKFVKIGITGRNPQERFDEHLKLNGWKRMVVIYQTSSARNANTLERWLVENHYDDLVNQRQGGGSQLSEDGPNYLYILLA